MGGHDRSLRRRRGRRRRAESQAGGRAAGGRQPQRGPVAARQRPPRRAHPAHRPRGRGAGQAAVPRHRPGPGARAGPVAGHRQRGADAGLPYGRAPAVRVVGHARHEAREIDAASSIKRRNRAQMSTDQATAREVQATSEDRRRRLALYVLCLGMLMIVLDATIVNVALPSIQEDLGFSQSDLAWVVNAYLIAFGGLLLLAGRIGDLIGQRRIFLIGLAVFTGASLVCAVAQSQGMLIGARFIQGVGGALTSAVILGMIVTMFPEPREQAKAIGVYTFVAVAGGSIGLIVGGVLTEAAGWHWIFFVNLPIGVATALAALRLVPGNEGIGVKQGADLPGAVLLTGGLMLGVYTILEVEEQGWGSTQTLALGGVALALLAGFLVRQARVDNPLMPLRLFRSRNVSGANLVQALLVVGAFGVFVLGALYMQR